VSGRWYVKHCWRIGLIAVRAACCTWMIWIELMYSERPAVVMIYEWSVPKKFASHLVCMRPWIVVVCGSAAYTCHLTPVADFYAHKAFSRPQRRLRAMLCPVIMHCAVCWIYRAIVVKFTKYSFIRNKLNVGSWSRPTTKAVAIGKFWPPPPETTYQILMKLES